MEEMNSPRSANIATAKYYPGEKVKSLTGQDYWVEAIYIYKDYIRYSLYDGKQDTICLEDWQIVPYEDSPRIGFIIEYSNWEKVMVQN